jgi:type VI secretion system protein ImpM
MSKPVSLAYFGKLASRGDFVRSAQHGSLTNMLDQWLSQGLDLLSVDPRWKHRYDQAEACCFAFLGVRNRVGLAGYLIPSVDAHGRRFPFVTAGSYEIDTPLSFMAHSPLALSQLWGRLASLGRDAHASPDATEPLATASHTKLAIDTSTATYASTFADFLEMQTIGSLEQLLRRSHHHLQLRRTLLAIGLLLQPIPTSGLSHLEKGLALPLPDDPLDAPLVSTLWMTLVSPFLAMTDFELALFVLPRKSGKGSLLCIGFAGGSPATLQAVFDGDARHDAFVDVVAADWADEQLGDDYAIKKLTSYLTQSQLSVSQAVRTFKECFLGE